MVWSNILSHLVFGLCALGMIAVASIHYMVGFRARQEPALKARHFLLQIFVEILSLPMKICQIYVLIVSFSCKWIIFWSMMVVYTLATMNMLLFVAFLGKLPRYRENFFVRTLKNESNIIKIFTVLMIFEVGALCFYCFLFVGVLGRFNEQLCISTANLAFGLLLLPMGYTSIPLMTAVISQVPWEYDHYSYSKEVKAILYWTCLATALASLSIFLLHGETMLLSVSYVIISESIAATLILVIWPLNSQRRILTAVYSNDLENLESNPIFGAGSIFNAYLPPQMAWLKRILGKQHKIKTIKVHPAPTTLDNNASIMDRRVSVLQILANAEEGRCSAHHSLAKQIFESDTLTAAFITFTEKMFCDEYSKFLLEVHNFRQQIEADICFYDQDPKVAEEWKRIMHRFIIIGAPYEVNISGLLTQSLQRLTLRQFRALHWMDQQAVFDEAYREVETMLWDNIRLFCVNCPTEQLNDLASLILQPMPTAQKEENRKKSGQGL